MNAERHLIPRKELFEGPRRTDPQLSPDGRYLAFVAALDGVDNVWVAPVDDVSAARAVSHDSGGGIRQYYWARSSRHLILAQDAMGNEHFGLSVIDLDSAQHYPLLHAPDAETRLLAFSEESDTELLLQSNQRNSAYFDIYHADIASGKVELLERNDRFIWVYADAQLRPRLAEELSADGGSQLFASQGDGQWRPFIGVSADDESQTRPFRLWECENTFAPGADSVYALDSRGVDKAALVSWNLDTAEATEIASDDQADIQGLRINPVSRQPDFVVCNDLHFSLRPLTDAAAASQTLIEAQLQGRFDIVSRSSDDERWLISERRSDNPNSYYLYETAAQSLSFLFTDRPQLQQRLLSPVHALRLTARDGLKLPSYFSYPPETILDDQQRPLNALPMVVLVHGGPWVRDDDQFDLWQQFLTSRGYAVLKVNFRGSRGFGKAFMNAGNGEWGAKMYDDVVDGVHWAVDQGIAQQDKIAIMGASFGGYTSLMGLVRDPTLYACGVDLFGVADLIHFLSAIPPHWKPYKAMWDERVGRTDSPAERRLLRQRSPISHLHTVRSPLLIAQGANDPRVRQAESDAVARTLADNGVEVVYLLYPDEGHSFQQMANQLSFFAVLEAFLARHLGGQHEPIRDSLQDSSLQVPIGAELLEALR